MKITAFSKYLTYRAGGAEVSTLEMLKKEESAGNKVQVVSQGSATFLGQCLNSADIPKNWELNSITGGIQLKRFPYIEFILNRKRIIDWFSKLDSDELWTYGIYGPSAAIGFKGKVKFFIRSESDLGISGNYYRGFKRIGKNIYKAIEYPACNLYRNDLGCALSKSKVISNSNYMAKRAYELFNVKSEVCYPPINLKEIRMNLSGKTEDAEYVVFIGDSITKGIDLVLELARKMKNINFKIFSRHVEKNFCDKNVHWSPWQKEGWMVFLDAKIVLVPSQWEEAYSRIARESYLLKIPTLVSNVGGLVEAVSYDSKCIVYDYKNIESWHSRLKECLSQSS